MSIRRAQDERIEGTPDGLNAITEIMDVPDTPSIGTATAAGLSASVTFTAATTGGTATTYTVTSTPSSITGTGASSPITVSGLADGTSYTFKVKGTNATGVIGPESSASNSITAVAPLEGAYDSLASVTLSATASSITFAGIPTGYKHLQIRASYQCSSTDNPYIRVGGGSIDSGGNYSWHHLFGNGTSAYSNGNGSQSFTYFGYSQNSTNPNAGIIDILDYASVNKNKTFRILAGQDNNGGGEIALWSGSWQNSFTAIGTISLITAGNFSTASSFALYGVK